MKSQTQESEGGALSEEERLQLLTTAGKRNRLFIMALAGVLGSLMLASVAMNIYSAFSAGDEPRVQALEKQVLRLEQQLVVQQTALSNQEEVLASQQASQLTGMFERVENPDSIAEVSKVLQAQERDYQQVMQGLKAGMRDLANMLPGSRSWLAHYEEAIDRAQLNSRQRSEDIQAWSDKAQQPAPAAKPPGTSVDPG
jgi:small-conductance mechanosensitive channel